jgi:DNA-directed RNA polymerase subunit RPC12/RpoP
MPKYLDLERDLEIRAELVCVLCSRAVGHVQGPNVHPLTGMSLRVPDPRHIEAVRSMRCPYCAGRLWIQNVEAVRDVELPLTDEELRPRRGRPPNMSRAS